MDDPALHYPPGAEPNPPTPEPQPEPTPPASEPAPETPPEPKPEEKTEKPLETPDAPEVPLPKPRSIYDDLKDKKQEAKAWKQMAVSALKTQGIELQGNETPEQIQALIEKHKTPDAPPEPPAPSTPTDELEAYAQEHGLDAKALGRLAEVITKRIPPSQLSEADRKELSDLKGWKQTKEAEEQRQAEDREVLAAAPTVKTQLEIHDDAELATVMAEIVKLSHTEAFHDKEVDYIVWKNRETLSKLVSPKKPSFESGGQQGDAAPEAEPDFSSGKGITPAMAEKAAHSKGVSALEIRRGK